MQLANTVKRAPKWAWYTVGGITVAVIGIRLWQGRGKDTTTTTDTTNATVSGTPVPVSSQPSPVIVPPVITQSGSGDGPDFAGMFGVFGDALGNAVNTIGGLAAGDQSLASTTITGSQEITRELVAGAGGAPQPVTQLPPIHVTVQGPTPAPTPRATPSTTPKCPATFPRWSGSGPIGAKTCYKCEKSSNKTYPYVHVYQDGHRVGVKNCN